jgi:hypothetical protein
MLLGNEQIAFPDPAESGKYRGSLVRKDRGKCLRIIPAVFIVYGESSISKRIDKCFKLFRGLRKKGV